MSLKKILVISGPNLNLLGKREPEIYGDLSLDNIYLNMQKLIDKTKYQLVCKQSNSEAKIIDWIQNAYNRYNAIILTQVLHILPDMESALQNVFSALVPGGVILATIPVITQVSRFDMERWGDYWRVTDKALELLAEKNLPNCQTAVTAYGNHLTALAALTGLAAEELTGSELEFFDPDYQILIGMYSKKRK